MSLAVCTSKNPKMSAGDPSKSFKIRHSLAIRQTLADKCSYNGLLHIVYMSSHNAMAHVSTHGMAGIAVHVRRVTVPLLVAVIFDVSS